MESIKATDRATTTRMSLTQKPTRPPIPFNPKSTATEPTSLAQYCRDFREQHDWSTWLIQPDRFNASYELYQMQAHACTCSSDMLQVFLGRYWSHLKCGPLHNRQITVAWKTEISNLAISGFKKWLNSIERDFKEDPTQKAGEFDILLRALYSWKALDSDVFSTIKSLLISDLWNSLIPLVSTQDSVGETLYQLSQLNTTSNQIEFLLTLYAEGHLCLRTADRWHALASLLSLRIHRPLDNRDRAAIGSMLDLARATQEAIGWLADEKKPMPLQPRCDDHLGKLFSTLQKRDSIEDLWRFLFDEIAYSMERVCDQLATVLETKHTTNLSKVNEVAYQLLNAWLHFITCAIQDSTHDKTDQHEWLQRLRPSVERMLLSCSSSQFPYFSSLHRRLILRLRGVPSEPGKGQSSNKESRDISIAETQEPTTIQLGHSHLSSSTLNNEVSDTRQEVDTRLARLKTAEIIGANKILKSYLTVTGPVTQLIHQRLSTWLAQGKFKPAVLLQLHAVLKPYPLSDRQEEMNRAFFAAAIDQQHLEVLKEILTHESTLPSRWQQFIISDKPCQAVTWLVTQFPQVIKHVIADPSYLSLPLKMGHADAQTCALLLIKTCAEQKIPVSIPLIKALRTPNVYLQLKDENRSLLLDTLLRCPRNPHDAALTNFCLAILSQLPLTDLTEDQANQRILQLAAHLHDHPFSDTNVQPALLQLFEKADYELDEVEEAAQHIVQCCQSPLFALSLYQCLYECGLDLNVELASTCSISVLNEPNTKGYRDALRLLRIIKSPSLTDPKYRMLISCRAILQEDDQEAKQILSLIDQESAIDEAQRAEIRNLLKNRSKQILSRLTKHLARTSSTPLTDALYSAVGETLFSQASVNKNRLSNDTLDPIAYYIKLSIASENYRTLLDQLDNPTYRKLSIRVLHPVIGRTPPTESDDTLMRAVEIFVGLCQKTKKLEEDIKTFFHSLFFSCFSIPSSVIRVEQLNRLIDNIHPKLTTDERIDFYTRCLTQMRGTTEPYLLNDIESILETIQALSKSAPSLFLTLCQQHIEALLETALLPSWNNSIVAGHLSITLRKMRNVAIRSERLEPFQRLCFDTLKIAATSADLGFLQNILLILVEDPSSIDPLTVLPQLELHLGNHSSERISQKRALLLGSCLSILTSKDEQTRLEWIGQCVSRLNLEASVALLHACHILGWEKISLLINLPHANDLVGNEIDQIYAQYFLCDFCKVDRQPLDFQLVKINGQRLHNLRAAAPSERGPLSQISDPLIQELLSRSTLQVANLYAKHAISSASDRKTCLNHALTLFRTKLNQSPSLYPSECRDLQDLFETIRIAAITSDSPFHYLHPLFQAAQNHNLFLSNSFLLSQHYRFALFSVMKGPELGFPKNLNDMVRLWNARHELMIDVYTPKLAINQMYALVSDEQDRKLVKQLRDDFFQ